jgi:hypothetical protein
MIVAKTMNTAKVTLANVHWRDGTPHRKVISDVLIKQIKDLRDQRDGRSNSMRKLQLLEYGTIFWAFFNYKGVGTSPLSP